MHYLFLLICLAILNSCSLCRDDDQAELRFDNLQSDLNLLYSNIDIPEVLTLENAIDIALERNLDIKVKELEWEIQKEVVTREKLKMLPAVVFSNEYSERNNSTAAFQQTPGQPIPPNPVISQQRQVRRWDMTATWNLLDFGLAYFRSQSEKNRKIVLWFQYERLKQNLILDVTKSYWKGMVAKKAISNASHLIELASDIRGRLNRQMELRILPAIPGLRSQGQLLELKLRLHNLARAYQASKAELASLMGVPPTINFELAATELCLPDEKMINDVFRLEDVALVSRPELYAADADEKLNTADIRVAIIQAFPRAESFLGYNENVDKFLVHHHWALVGARTVWNLFSIPWHIQDTKAAMRRRDMSHQSRLALSVAVMTQVNLARLKYLEALSQYTIRHEMYEIRLKIREAARKEFAQGEFHIATLLDYEYDALQSEIDDIQAFGDLQVAVEQLANAMGQPRYFCRGEDEQCY